MAALAAFHTAAASFEISPDDEEWFGGPAFGIAPTVIDRVQLSTRRLIGGELQMVRTRITASDLSEFAALSRRVVRSVERLGRPFHEELTKAATLSVPVLPVLRDVWHDHVLFVDDQVTGLIDPSACRRDTVAADLSRLLGSLIGDDRDRWNEAIDAYERHRPLTQNERRLIPILDRSGVLLSAINWVRRRYLFDADCDSPAVVLRLRQLVERLDRMQ